MATTLQWQRFHAPLRFTFKHASAARSSASSVLVRVCRDGLLGHGEACPRPYVTGETEASVLAFLADQGEAWATAIQTVDDLRDLILAEAAVIDRNPAAFGALEMAMLDVMAQADGTSVEALLGLPEIRQDMRYSAILGDSGPSATRVQSWVYTGAGFHDFKVKLGPQIDRDVQRFATLPQSLRLRVDANNLFDRPAACSAHIRALGHKVWAIEEPVEPGGIEGQIQVAQETGARIILDESLFNTGHLTGYSDPSQGWIANVRVSKCGGILRAIALAQAAQGLGMDIIIGAHVGETSLLSRAALTVSQALNRPPLAREGAFGLILVTEDIARPSLRFGWKGMLRAKHWNFDKRPGFGLSISPKAVAAFGK